MVRNGYRVQSQLPRENGDWGSLGIASLCMPTRAGRRSGYGAAASCALAAGLLNTTWHSFLFANVHQIDRYRRSEHGERLR